MNRRALRRLAPLAAWLVCAGLVPTRAGTSPARHDVLPLVLEPETRWTFGPFAFESEPEVEGGTVFVAGRDPTGRRALVVLDAERGRVQSRTLFPSPVPLVFSASGERVAVRTAAGRVDVFRVRGTRFVTERALTEPWISAPRLEDEELLVCASDGLERHDLRASRPAWSTKVPGALHGAPEARGEHVFAGWYEPDGTAHLAWLERSSGRVLGDVVLGRNKVGRAPEDRDGLRVFPEEGCVFVQLAAPIPTTSGGELAWARVPFDGTHTGTPTLHDFLAPPLETADGWVAPERTRNGTARWILVRRDPGGDATRERAIELASNEHHAWLSACTAPASRAGDVLYLGPCAADARTLQVLWRRETRPAFRSVPLDGGLLVIEDGVLTCLGAEPAAPLPERERASERVAALERALGEELARVASQALRAGDGELAARLSGEAADLGASGRTLALVESEAQRTKNLPHDARGDARRGALLAQESAARAQLPHALLAAARAASSSAAELALLDELFRRAPEDAGGLDELRHLVPAGASVEPGQARAWLEFLELAAAHPIEVVNTPADERAPTPEEHRLAEERQAWRPDALGWRSERVLLVTAGAAPDAIARTLRTGELVCDVLEQVFGGARSAAEPLELVLYPTRDEYLSRSGSDLGGLETVLGFTAGHYDLAAQVSRLYLPEGDRDGARLLGVSAHELTHHWLATRSTFGPPRAAPAATGFWVVEGIATWAEELHLDPEQRTWSTQPGRAASLDTLVNAGARDLLPWRALLADSFEEYTKLETRTTCTLALDWQLGAHAPRSPMQLFYAQAGALAHYLYASENGANRALLLRAVESYYRGQPLDVATALGASPEELGARVLAWAREATKAARARR